MVEPSTVAVTVTVVAPAPSVTDTGSRLSDTVLGVASSSLTPTEAVETVTLASTPLKVTVASASSTLSFCGVTATVLLPDRFPAGIVMVNVGMAATPTPPEVRAAVTVRLCGVSKETAPCTVAVTVTATVPALSIIDGGLVDRAMLVGVASSSVIVTVVEVLVPRL